MVECHREYSIIGRCDDEMLDFRQMFSEMFDFRSMFDAPLWFLLEFIGQLKNRGSVTSLFDRFLEIQIDFRPMLYQNTKFWLFFIEQGLKPKVNACGHASDS